MDAVLICFGLSVLAYVWFVNRRRQRYSGSALFEASAQEIWPLLVPKPGEPPWMPGIEEIRAVEGAPDETTVVFRNGHEMRVKDIVLDEPWRLETMSRYRWRNAPDWGDMVAFRAALEEDGDGRTLMRCDYAIERAGLFNGFLPRLNYPLINWLFALMLRQEIARRRAASPWEGVPPSPRKRPKPSFSWFQLLLLIATGAWLTTQLGWALASAFLAFIAIHEYGHVWAMRRHGQANARFYFAPFFGGLAVGERGRLSDAEGAEVILMGPAFGFLPGAALALTYWATDHPWAGGAGMMLLIVNLFNLAPVPPLDGGLTAQLLLRPFGERIWVFASWVLILSGIGTALYFGSWFFAIVFCFSALLWKRTRIPPDRAGMTLRQWTLTLIAYVGLIGAHLGVMQALAVFSDWDALGDALRNGLNLF